MAKNDENEKKIIKAVSVLLTGNSPQNIKNIIDQWYKDHLNNDTSNDVNVRQESVANHTLIMDFFKELEL